MPRSESIIGSRNCYITHSHTFAARMQITTGSAKFSKVSFAQIITRAAAQRHKSLREVWKAYNYLPGFYERSYFYCWTPRPLYSQHYAMNKHVFAAATRTRSDASLRQLREGEWDRERERAVRHFYAHQGACPRWSRLEVCTELAGFLPCLDAGSWQPEASSLCVKVIV